MNKHILPYLKSKDKVLENVIETIPAPEIISTKNVFHDLMSCILEQQIHYRSTKKTFQRMLVAAEMNSLTPTNFEHFEALGLKDKKLSTQKYETLEQVVDYFENNTIHWEQLSDEEVRAILVNIKGISNWTADMILMYTLERDKVLPLDDYHLKQLMGRLYQVEGKKAMRAVGEHWAPYQSWAVKYLFGWKEFHKKQ
ncbi:DNA-3-methyladenine glycosylase [Lewinella sp. LCG006]|uniref:DNA-3-methyladenine glycosylase family protein n=1 Tax=Lewinella sp. LCG006 TaxID=3231911 RepID=UPI003460517B